MDVFLPLIRVPVVQYGQGLSSGRDTTQGVQAKKIREFVKWKALECNGLFRALE